MDPTTPTMHSTAYDPTDDPMAADTTSESDPRSLRADLARRSLMAAALMGVLASALLHDMPWGISLPIWIAVLLGIVVDLVWRKGDLVQREQAAWMGGALAFAATFAWRDAELLLFFGLVATLLCLTMVASTLAGAPVASLLHARVRDLLRALATTVADAAGRIVPLALRDADWPALGATLPRNRAAPLVRGLVLALPLVLVFGALLRSADPMFAALLALPSFDFESVFSHVVVFGVYAWIVGGWLRGALVAPRAAAPVQEPRIMTLGRVETTIVLGAIAGLFALFVLVQLRWLFGGEDLVRRTTGLGYAEYARRGFFELAAVAILSLPVLLGVHAALDEADHAARTRFRLLGLVVVALLGAVLASAVGRMALYVRFYGLSADRVFASAVMTWIAIVLAWLAVTVLRGRPRTFAAGLVLSALGVLAALNVVNPERLVARVNLARAPEAAADARGGARPVDLVYLARLGADAVPLVVPAVVAPRSMPAVGSEAERTRCSAAQELVRRWAEGARHSRDEWDWRRWNAARSRAREVVRRHESALRAVPCPRRQVDRLTG